MRFMTLPAYPDFDSAPQNSVRCPQLFCPDSVYRLVMSLTRIPGTALLMASALLIAGSFMPLRAQPTLQTKTAPADSTPASTATTLSVNAKLVNIPVVVLDKRGALVRNLTKDNFEIKVDDRAQTIHYFNVDTDLPLTLGLLVDTSMSQRDVIDDERAASFAFLDDMLNGPADRDKAFVVQFARQTDLLQDVTSSKPKLQAGLKDLATSSEGGDSGGKNSGSDTSGVSAPGARRGGGTALYDALFLSSDEVIGKQKGRKALIILSDGVDSGSKESLASALEAAQRADTIVYAIYYKGREAGGFQQNRQDDRRGGGYPGGGYPGGGYPGGGYPGGGGGYPGGGGRGGGQQRPQDTSRPDGRKTLQRMADETGGRLFEVSKKETLADIYKEIGEELRSQYRLGYTPDKDTSSDGFHRIDLSFSKATANAKDLYIQTRDGYYIGN
jgi:VWFA-related protein